MIYARNTIRAVTAVALAMLVPALASAQQPFTIGSITAAPGTTASGTLAVPARNGDTGTTVPISIVHGTKPGPVLALTAGVHGQEYTPVLALQRLLRTLDAKTLSGTVIMVHVSNMPSYLSRTIYYSPADGKNLNRVFPGKEDGTRHLGMRADGPAPVAQPIWIERSEVLRSSAYGIFYAAVERGHTVAQGTAIGRITDFHGKTIEEVRAPFAGEILYVIGTPAISTGEPIAFVGSPVPARRAISFRTRRRC